MGLLAETSEIYSCETDSDCIIYEEQSKCGDYCILPNKGDDDSNGGKRVSVRRFKVYIMFYSVLHGLSLKLQRIWR